jgi:HK97 gp10 family phage protein
MIYKNGISVRVNVARVVRNNNDRKRLYSDTMVKRLKASANLVRNEAIRSILKGPATGRIYKRRSVTHQASAPGEAPMSDTGTLARSVYIDDRTTSRTNLRIAVVAGSRYARWLEYGTRKMRPRPFMSPALQSQVNRIRNILRAAFRK